MTNDEPTLTEEEINNAVYRPTKINSQKLGTKLSRKSGPIGYVGDSITAHYKPLNTWRYKQVDIGGVNLSFKRTTLVKYWFIAHWKNICHISRSFLSSILITK